MRSKILAEENAAEFKSKHIMKNGIHPDNYRLVVFKDMSNDEMFLCKSTAETRDTIEYEGETYPLVKMEISSTSHPFYTGKVKLVDTAGRVDKFMNKYKKFAK
ncbi:LSU ribosomal protein L31P [Cruoricaptor ignavus]|uniref:Large ribosomal subunit protein bL31B n=2 Tax=Cruoricaptor ignavus TaxID=1118202 RepID=A0A1M6CW49_9FLAO|nr:LSU ribosomal protein L31P [Cruoricaptor ignavus]